MKQRLLLVLLALFTSIGWMKADDQTVTLTIPAGKSITVSFDNTSGIETTPSVQFSGKSFTYKNENKTNDATFVISKGTYASMTINGGATKITFANSGSDLKTLTIGNGDLASLDLDGALNTITELTIGTNKLITVPGKQDKMTKYSIGVQSPTLTLNENASWKPANEGYKPILDNLFGSNNHYYKKDGVSFELVDWQYASGGSASAVVHHTPGTDNYYFYKGGDTYKEGDEYIDGEFTCTVKFSGQYEGVQIKGAHVKVLPALYEGVKAATILPENVDNKLTYQLSNGVSGHAIPGTVSKGDVFRISATPADGYSIGVNGFSESKGFDIKADGNTFLFTVNGKATPEITAKFTAEGQPITIKEPSNGTFVVMNGSTTLKNGDKPATGTKLTIKATPNLGYKLDKMMLNGSALKLVKTDGQTSIFEYIVEADSEELIFSASFVQADLFLTMQWTQADMKSVNLDTDGGTAVTGVSGGLYKKTWNVPYNTKPTITLQTVKDAYITSIIANNEPVAYTVTKKQTESDGTIYQITDFDMQSRDVTMVVNTSGKSEAKIIVDFASANNGNYTGEEIVYDGTAKTIPYTTYPANLSNVVVKYYNANGEELSSVVEAGKYTAVFSRASDDIYGEAIVVNKSDAEKQNGTVAFEVKAATLVITKDPSVTIDKETGEYKITTGTVGYKRGSQTVTIDSKKCVWEVVRSNQAVEKTELTPDENGNYGSEVVTVRVHIKANANEDWDKTSNMDKNFEANATIEVKARGQKDDLKTAQVKVLTSKMPEGTSLTLMNGGKELGTSASVLKGATIAFSIEEGRYEASDLEVYRVDEQGNKVGSAITQYELQDGDSEVYFLLIPKNGLLDDLQELALISANDKETNGTPNHTYNGKVHNFNTEVIKVKNKATGKTVTGVNWSNATITYKEDKTNQVTTAPINAGSYTVTIKRAADNTYKEFTATGTMYIEQATPNIVTWPNTKENDPAYIGEGQALSTAVLTGGVASVEGHFDWITPDKIVKVDGQYDIKFVSEDPNYKDVSSSANNISAWVKITKETILSIATDDTYTITAKGSDGKTYTNGMTVPVGTTLTFTVTPASGYRLNTLYVNGKAISGNTYKTTAGPVSVKAEMSREYTITLGSAPRGVKIATKPSSNVVVAGGSYTFTLNHVSGDKPTVTGASNISVSTSGSTTTVKVTNIQANATLAIALANPTAIKITTKETLSAAGKSMGTIRVSGVNSSNECYYGDKITVTATANAGVEFSGWENLTSTENPYEFEATNATYTFQAKYHGTLTGIESVDELKYYGGDGYIFVNCPAQGTLTIISMNGRAQKMSVSGQTRVTVPAGVYGIVLTSGSEVVRDKVVVR